MTTKVPFWKLGLASVVLVTVALSLAALPALAEWQLERGRALEPSASAEPEDNLALAFDAPLTP